MAVVMATGCQIGKMVIAKVAPNTTNTHTPPPTGNIPTFYDGKGKQIKQRRKYYVSSCDGY